MSANEELIPLEELTPEQTETEAVEETEAEAVEETEAEATQETELEATQETEAEATQETEAEATQETELEATQETEAEATQETELEATQETELEATQETELEATQETPTVENIEMQNLNPADQGPPLENDEQQRLYREFTTNPEEFMAENPVVLQGEALNVASGERTFRFYIRPDDPSKYRVAPSSVSKIYPGQNFQVHYLKVRQIKPNDLAQPFIKVTPYKLNSDGPHLMITTQLTGCSFCFSESDDGVFVAHIQPNPEEQISSEVMNAALRDKLRFDIGNDRLINGNIQIFGASDPDQGYNQEGYTYVMGHRNNEGEWNFPVQTMSRNGQITGSSNVGQVLNSGWSAIAAAGDGSVGAIAGAAVVLGGGLLVGGGKEKKVVIPPGDRKDEEELETKQDQEELETKQDQEELEAKQDQEELETKQDQEELEAKQDQEELEAKQDQEELEAKQDQEELEAKQDQEELEAKQDQEELEDEQEPDAPSSEPHQTIVIPGKTTVITEVELVPVETPLPLPDIGSLAGAKRNPGHSPRQLG